MSHTRRIYDVHQDTSGKYSVTLADENKIALSNTVLETLTLTLYNATTLDIINNRDGQDVLNTNGVTVDCDGVLEWSWDADDMPLQTTTKENEIHTALFTAGWGAGLKQAYIEASFRIHKVTIPS